MVKFVFMYCAAKLIYAAIVFIACILLYAAFYAIAHILREKILNKED